MLQEPHAASSCPPLETYQLEGTLHQIEIQGMAIDEFAENCENATVVKTWPKLKRAAILIQKTYKNLNVAGLEPAPPYHKNPSLHFICLAVSSVSIAYTGYSVVSSTLHPAYSISRISMLSFISVSRKIFCMASL